MKNNHSKSRYTVLRPLALCALMLLTTGCAAKLDLRCDDVTERIRMHAGVPWKLELLAESTTRQATQDVDRNNENNSVASDVDVLRQAVDAKQSPSLELMEKYSLDFTDLSRIFEQRQKLQEVTAETRKYCEPKKKKSRATTTTMQVGPALFPAAGAPKDVISLQDFDPPIGISANDIKPCPSPAEIRVAAEKKAERERTGDTSPDPGVSINPLVPQTVQAARAKYLDGNQFYLNQQELRISGVEDPVTLKLLNEGLNCKSYTTNNRWLCKSNPLTPIVNGGSTEAACAARLNTRPGRKHHVNLLGVIDERYCLYISVTEHKRARHWQKPSPTNINDDILEVSLECNAFGDVGPKSVGSGPRPNVVTPGRMTPSSD
jgi:hypothetical protein